VRLHTRIRRRVWAAARARGANVSAAVILAAPALSRPPAHVTKGRAERAVLNICCALDTLVCPSSAVGRGHAPRTAVGLACVGPYGQRLWLGTTAAPQPLGGFSASRTGGTPERVAAQSQACQFREGGARAAALYQSGAKRFHTCWLASGMHVCTAMSSPRGGYASAATKGAEADTLRVCARAFASAIFVRCLAKL